MEHLDTATLEDFKAFNKKILYLNNAVLVVAGDFEKVVTKMDSKILWPNQKAEKQNFIEEPITQTLKQLTAIKHSDPYVSCIIQERHQ
jgi:predicted Zn-dependent peptidase